jgi:hypothetical protein
MEDCVVASGKPDAHGYPRAGRNVLAHRRVYEDQIGPIPEGMIIHHICENRMCVNPRHLEAMTRGDHNRLHRGVPSLTPQERRERRLAQMREYTRQWRS